MKSETYREEAPAPAISSRSSHEINLLDVLIVLANRWRFILWFTCGVTVLTAIVVLILPSRYTAQTVLLPPQQNSSAGSALLSQIGGSGALASLAGSSLGIKNPADMYVALFRSRTVEDALIQQFGLMARYHKRRMSDARTAFEDRSIVVAGAKDGLIRIDVTDHDPQLAADIANSYVEQYRKLSATLAVTEAAQRRAFFQQQLLEADAKLSAAEEAMKNTEEKTGMLSLDSQARSLIESAAVLRGQISAKEVELQAMSSYATPDNPQVVLAQQQLGALRDQLAKLSGTASNTSSEILLPKGSIPQAGMEYLNKLRDVRYYETIVELMAKEFEMAKLDEAREGAVVQVVDAAIKPDKWSFPKRTLTIGIAALLGFFMACSWCLAARSIESFKSRPENRQRLDTLLTMLRGQPASSSR